MPEPFDPYYQWLGIPPEEQPPDHYRLLGIDWFEENFDVIDAAADRQTVHLRMFQMGPQGALSQELLNQVAAARICLLDPAKKAIYDRQLRERFESVGDDAPARSETVPIESKEESIDEQWEAMVAAAEQAPPTYLAPLRRKIRLKPWIIGGTVILLLVLCFVGAVKLVSWGKTQAHVALDRLRQRTQADARPAEPTSPATSESSDAVLGSSAGEGPSWIELLAMTEPEDAIPVPPLLRTFRGHARPITGVAFSSDGRHIATGSKDHSVRLWDVESDKPVWTGNSHVEEVNAVAFTSDGSILATAGGDRTIRLWDVPSGNLLETLSGHERPIRALAFSPDGTVLASTGHDRTVRLWEVASGELIRMWKAHDENIMALAFSPDGQFVATGGVDRLVRLWQVDTGRLVQTWSGHQGVIRAIAFSPDGARLASGAEDGQWAVWELPSGKLVRMQHGHDDRILAVAFSPDGTVLATGGRRKDPTIRLWSPTDGRLLETFLGHKHSVGSVAFSPDGTKLISGGYDRTAKLWEVDTASSEAVRE